MTTHDTGKSSDHSTPSRGPLARRPTPGARTLITIARTTTTRRIRAAKPGLSGGLLRARQYIQEDGTEGEADAADGHHRGTVGVVSCVSDI